MERLLVLVRHGQSEWNLKNLFTGWKDPGLTEQGIREAHEAGRKPEAPLVHDGPCPRRVGDPLDHGGAPRAEPGLSGRALFPELQEKPRMIDAGGADLPALPAERAGVVEVMCPVKP